MNSRLTISFFGSSLAPENCSAAELFYRSLTRALAERGHRVMFYQPNNEQRGKSRAARQSEGPRVVTYHNSDESALDALESAEESDVIIKCSGVGACDDLLEAAVLELKKPETLVAFLDMDPHATLDCLQKDPENSFKALIPEYDFIFAHGATQAILDDYTVAGAAECVPLQDALDPHNHHPVERDPRFQCDVANLCDHTQDNESLVEEFLLKPAIQMPERKFLLAGSGWEGKAMPSNVHLSGAIPPQDRNAFYSSATAVLNIDAGTGLNNSLQSASIFEAGGAGACLLTDRLDGIELFLEPGREVLVIRSGQELIDQMKQLSPELAREIGRAALQRLLASHTFMHRADQLVKAFEAKAGRLVS